ncbi:SH3 domain-containing protein [Isoptericola sp. NPDC057559]|uniref:SH3 domain-containing protein n=1 Tax=Isoptericola sp. NPDC057559 TaxID=3346168 RepID=UPI0036B72F74
MKTSSVQQRLGAVLGAAALALGVGVASVLVAPPAGASSGVVAPLPAKTYSLSSYYGPRCMPVAGASTWHLGQDMGAARGVRVGAIADGVVLKAGATPGFGQVVVVRHTIGGRTVSSVYGHVVDGDRYVRAGQKVSAGQRIADVGSSGNSTGPHLHLEVWNGVYGAGATHTDPLTYLRGRGVDLRATATRVAVRSTPTSCTYYASSQVNLRSGPSTTSPVLAVVPRAATLTAKPGAASGTWRQVTYGARTGWVSASYVTPRRPATAPPTTTAPAAPTAKTAYVNVASLNLRTGASTSSGVVAHLAKGTKVTRVAAPSKGWVKITTGGRTGYVWAAYLTSTAPAKPTTPTAPTATVAYVNAASLNLRAKPSTASAVVARLAKGTKVTQVAAPSKGWVKVKAGTRTGYVATSYLTTKAPATKPGTTTPAAKVSYVTVASLNLRAKASTSSSVLARLAKGTKVTHVGAASKGWQKVTVGKRTGFVSTAYLSATKPR